MDFHGFVLDKQRYLPFISTSFSIDVASNKS